MHILRITIFAAGAFLTATGTHAQNSAIVEGGLPTAVVSYADLNLASPQGRQALDRRAVHAAADLCLDNQRAPVDEMMARRHCYSTALSNARFDIQQAVARASSQLASQGSILVAAK